MSRRHRQQKKGPPLSATSAPVVSLITRQVRPWQVALVLLLFTGAYLGLEWRAFTQTAATMDEPIHVANGYASLHDDYRVDPEHPPFLRMWAALPLLTLPHVVFDSSAIDRTPSPRWVTEKTFDFAHQFLYTQNDADRLLYRGRFMMALWGVVLGWLLFSWAYEWLGFTAAVLALVFCTLEPNLAAHASLVTTDIGLTVFVFGGVYFLWRTCRRPTVWNVVGLTLCCALAAISKFSAILLAPLLSVLFVTAIGSRRLGWRTAGGLMLLLLVTTWLSIWGIYGFRYAPSPSPTWLFQLQTVNTPGGDSPAVLVPHLTSVLTWVDGHRLLPNAFTQGLLFSQAKAQMRNAFLMGENRTGGWWYYFPVALTIKTPLVLLTLMAVGVVAGWRGRNRLGPLTEAFVGLPILMFLGIAMTSRLDIGLRHVLPIVPFFLLVAVVGADSLLSGGRIARTAFALLLVGWIAEFAGAYPHTLTFFNQLVGGPSNGFRYLADSNVDWGQDLKGLKQWMDQSGTRQVNLAYFGSAAPAYYGIRCFRLPSDLFFAADCPAGVQLPGYVAVSTSVLDGSAVAPVWRLFYRPFLDLTPVADLGHSIHVYWVERWPIAPLPAADGSVSARNDEIDVRGALATALDAQGWSNVAMTYYQQYLRVRPNDSRALLNLGVAELETDHADLALQSFRRAADVAPDDWRAQLNLATLLIDARQIGEAAAHAERAAALRPREPRVLDLLGRVRALQGRMAEAAADFEQSLQVDPSYAEARQHLEVLKKLR